MCHRNSRFNVEQVLRVRWNCHCWRTRKIHKGLDVTELMWKTFPLPCPEPKTLTSRKMTVGAEGCDGLCHYPGRRRCVGREGTLPVTFIWLLGGDVRGYLCHLWVQLVRGRLERDKSWAPKCHLAAALLGSRCFQEVFQITGTTCIQVWAPQHRGQRRTFASSSETSPVLALRDWWRPSCVAWHTSLWLCMARWQTAPDLRYRVSEQSVSSEQMSGTWKSSLQILTGTKTMTVRTVVAHGRF